ncbi:MAG: hypothetical protein AAF702_50845 [Chloroflexota bacterium]
MKHANIRNTLYFLTFILMLSGFTTVLFDNQVAGGRSLLQTIPPDNDTIPPGTIPPGTLPLPDCPEGVQAIDSGKIMVFLEPVAIYSGCTPPVRASALMTETGFVPTLLYNVPSSGFPDALGYIGTVYAVFDYSSSELDRLIAVLESFQCEDIGRPLEVCNQVNGIRVSQTGVEYVSASVMRSDAERSNSLPDGGENETRLYLPIASN